MITLCRLGVVPRRSVSAGCGLHASIGEVPLNFCLPCSQIGIGEHFARAYDKHFALVPSEALEQPLTEEGCRKLESDWLDSQRLQAIWLITGG
eukprot:329706-Amphidinium_carterae.1